MLTKQTADNTMMELTDFIQSYGKTSVIVNYGETSCSGSAQRNCIVVNNSDK